MTSLLKVQKIIKKITVHTKKYLKNLIKIQKNYLTSRKYCCKITEIKLGVGIYYD
jgi:hypothetical protein